jgi:hypothetical protein
VRDPPPGEQVHWERAFLYPNGDLLAICCGHESPYGYGLVKFDKNSDLLWGYSAYVHHDVDVGEDGRIYLLTHKANVSPPVGLTSLPSPCIAEFLVVLSPEGQELESIPFLEAFRDSSYALALLSGNESDPAGPFPRSGQPFPPGNPPPGNLPPGNPPLPPPAPGNPPLPSGRAFPGMPGDVLHVNSVKVLSQALAPKFPLFKPGQVLLSLRTPSLLAVLDIPTRSIVWAARGVWQCQHDAQFLNNGNLLLFDNLGSSKGARVLEYHPGTQAIPWSSSGDKPVSFTAMFRGSNQRLPNGNTLIVDPEGLQIIEVTRNNEVVWQWGQPSPPPRGQSASPDAPNFTGARRYSIDELTFLKEDPHAPTD